MSVCDNHVIDHEETRMIDQNKKPTAVSLAGVMRIGKEERLSKRKVLAGTV